MARSVFKRLIVDSKTNARGSFVLNPNGYGAPPTTSLKRLLFQFTLTGDAIVVDLEKFAQSVIITGRYRDGSPCVEAVNASLLDFRQAAYRMGDNHSGLGDFASPGIRTSAADEVKLNLFLEFTDPRRREANDVSVPLAEIGQFNIQANFGQGITGGGVSGAECTMFALCSEEKEPVLGLRPVYALQNLQGQSTTWDNGGRILRSIDALATGTHLDNADPPVAVDNTLADSIYSGFSLFCDGEQTVDCTTIPTVEEFNAQFGEPHYKPITAIFATNVALQYDGYERSLTPSGGGYGYTAWKPTQHGRIFDLLENVSATELQVVNKMRFQANSPGAAINSVQLLITGYEPQTAESIQRRKAALGLSLASSEPNVSDTQAGQSLSPSQKATLPSVVGTR